MSFTWRMKKFVVAVILIGFTCAHFSFISLAVGKSKSALKDSFTISAPIIDFTKGTKVAVTITPKKGHSGQETIVFQLMQEKKIISQKVTKTNIASSKKFSTKFKANHPSYWVQVHVVDTYREKTKKLGKKLASSVSTLPKKQEFTKSSIGKVIDPMNSYFSLVKDNPSIQLITDAQKWYVEKYIKKINPTSKDIPVLSATTLFQAGENGVNDFTTIKKGNFTSSIAEKLYSYNHTLKAVRVKGSVLKEWLEMSASVYNQIDPKRMEEQTLVNPNYKTYQFDVIDGITYQIDVTKPARYDVNGNKLSDSSRIKKLKYKDKTVDSSDEFLVATNSYRAWGGGNFPGVKKSKQIVSSSESIQQILIDYLSEEKRVNPMADDNWSIAPIHGEVPITFATSPKAAETLPKDGPISFTKTIDSRGFGIYKYNLSKPENSNIKVQLLGINDFHGQMDTTTEVNGVKQGRADYLASYIKQREAENKENTLLITAGDAVGASAPVSSKLQDKPTLEFLNTLGFDVGTVGNHEFDKGLETLLAQINGGKSPTSNVTFDGLDFPYVVANVVYKDTRKPILNPYVIKKVGGVDIGFIGVVTNTTPTKVGPGAVEKVDFTEQAPAVNQAVKELKAQGVKAIVVIAHDPGSDKKGVPTGEVVDLAKDVDDEVDVIFAGDNHVKLNTVVDGKLIVEALSYGTALADVDLEIDSFSGDIVDKSAEIVAIKQEGVLPDKGTTELIDKYLAMLPELGRPIGLVERALVKANVYKKEIALGNLVADSMRAELHSDFAFIVPGGIRSDLPQGNINYADASRVLPFGHVLVKLELTGAEIKKLLQQQWFIPDSPKTLQISGLKYKANLEKPVEERITALTKMDGTPIEDSITYTVAVNDFMANGGDNFTVLRGKAMEYGPLDIDAFVHYLVRIFREDGGIHAKVENRIVFGS